MQLSCDVDHVLFLNHKRFDEGRVVGRRFGVGGRGSERDGFTIYEIEKRRNVTECDLMHFCVFLVCCCWMMDCTCRARRTT